jgi:hypothetical protein
MTSFSDYIQNQAMAPAELPMVHTTEYHRLPSIQSSHQLQAHACRVFGEDLLYFFYGRPAYRDASQTAPTRDVGFYPICFVFRPGSISKGAKRLYPFDSGASQTGMYEPAIDRAHALATYPVVAAIENARRIVGRFFETDEQYLSNNPRAGLFFSAGEHDAESYYQFINGGGDPACDDRCSAIEIQVAGCVDLQPNVMAIVLPTSFLDDDALAHTLLKVWRAQPLTYDADIGMRPIEYHGTIRHLIRGFYRRQGLL